MRSWSKRQTKNKNKRVNDKVKGETSTEMELNQSVFIPVPAGPLKWFIVNDANFLKKELHVSSLSGGVDGFFFLISAL